ncbi:MAG: amidase domain-containing protein [Epulopiscium sp. Nele67-Bin005]|nr:MAG: amidase domain-containing protein [Epulopiscium sp. Nele67-Bin005]
MRKINLFQILLGLSLITTSSSYEVFASDIIFELPLIEAQEFGEDETEDTPPQTPSENNEIPTTEDELKEYFTSILQDVITKRNNFVLNHDTENLKSLYNTDIKVSLYAYEHEAIKAKYLDSWAAKQGVTFNSINSEIKVRKARDRGDGVYGMTCNVCTTFNYSYNDSPTETTDFRLGTSHYIHLKKNGDNYIIVKEWYTDPFSDSLELSDKNTQAITEHITKHTAPDYTPNERTQKAIEYAHTHCGIGDGEHMFKYNPEYMDCNPLGGDCANFASQIMFEGAGFKKNATWNYTHEGTKVWVNAQAFTHYIVNSGRGGQIAKGSYEKVYKAAYQMRPGDFVAYEKNGRITHVSTVSGLDSKGYPLVTCHNTDRLLVPYDLGWSNSNITFYLIDVYY